MMLEQTSLPMHKVTQSQNLYTHPAGIQLRGRHPGFSIQQRKKKLAVRLRDEPAQEGNVDTLQTQVTEGRTVLERQRLHSVNEDGSC